METSFIGLELQPVLEFAVRAHKGQFRKHSGLPYIVHPMGVLWQLAHWGISELTTWEAGICHDILEECPHLTDALSHVIRAEAFTIVQELTFIVDNTSLLTAKEQKAEYMASFATKSIPAMVIKAADRVLNSTDFLAVDPKYARKYWSLGDSVFKAIMQRPDEIKARYGEPVFPRIMYSRSHFNYACQ